MNDGNSGRIVSLDKFRGYTVLGMLVVNFLGRYDAVAPILKHHNTYCSYADTIMPQFFFAVGFAYRLTLLKNLQRLGPRRAFGHVLTRNLGLILLGVVLYGLDGGANSWSALREVGLAGFLQTAFQRDPFQTLVHIGLASLWVAPVMAAPAAWRLAFAAASAALHAWLSNRFYFDYAWSRPVIDGGPLGFLTWTLPLVAGSLALDVWTTLGPRRAILPMLVAASVLMIAGQGMTALGPGGFAPWPFVPPPSDRAVDMWTMSQRTVSVSYLVFSSGFSLLAYCGFVAACDLARVQFELLRTFGQNALAAYVLHGLVDAAVARWTPPDAPLWYVLTALAIYLILCWLFVRHLERQNLFIRM